MLILIGLLCLTGQVLSQQTGVYLSLGGIRITNNSHVDIDSIGTSDSDTDALLCHTDGADGKWHYYNSTNVEDISAVKDTSAFVSNKNQTVAKLFRTNTTTIGERFYCMANGILNYINILDIGAVTILPSGPIIEASQQSFSLQCSLDLLVSFLPPSVPAPKLVWLFNSTNASLPDGMMSNSSSNGNITYTHTLRFSPLLESNTGTYTCQIEGNDRQSANTSFTIFTIQVYDSSDSQPVVGQGYNLFCIASINVTGYQWRKNGQIIQEEMQQILVFPSLNLSDAGNYTCEVIINSNNYTADNKSIILEIPAPLSIVVTSNIANPIRPIGANVTLTCTVELSPVVNVQVTVNFQMIDPAGSPLTTTPPLVSGSTYTTTAAINSFGREHSGPYNCTAKVMATEPYLLYLDDSRAIGSNETRITTGVYLFQDGVALPNNSIATSLNLATRKDTIGFPICYTDKPDCCLCSSEGDWLLPDGTSASSGTRDNKFSVYRSDRTINLTTTNVEYPLGAYCCIVPDIDDINQTVCVNSGPTISFVGSTTAILGKNYNITCSVTGITVTTYEWTKDNEDVQPETGSTLSFTPLRLSDAGVYSCIINDNQRYRQNWELSIPIPAPISLTLVTDMPTPVRPSGSNVTLTCTVMLDSNTHNLSELVVIVHFSKNNATLAQFSSANISKTILMYSIHLESFRRSNSGNYTCMVIVSPQSFSSHIISNTVIRTLKVSTGVLLSINETILNNNSVVSINKIGNESDEALLCFTDLHLFHPDASIYEEVGQWYFPNGSIVSEMNETTGDIYTSRSQEVVRLHRKNNAIMPTGVFHCKILDSNFMNQSIYVRILPIHQGLMRDSISSLLAGAAGAVVCGLLIITAGLVLTVFAIRRLRARSKLSHHARGFSEPLEAIDSTKLPSEPDIDKGECIELNECDEIQADKDGESNFIDTTLIDGECMKPIPVSEFCNHVEQLHADRDKLFETEYTRLSRLPKFCTSEAKFPYNAPKNRFANISPYDCSRVKLSEIDGEEGSDYINANHLDGYNKPNAYIAAQGPLPNTVDDFWRMIWENELSTIVMLTRCFEGAVKCEKYWPVNVGESISPCHDLTITLTAVLPFTNYSIRKMTVTHSGAPDNSPQEVIQFHFLGWPDHGVPQNRVVLINFIRRVRIIHPYSDPCPLLVHCSAGVGRTGAFIVLDSMLERMKKEDNLNIFEFLKQLRAQRMLMVQTQAQYNFIHDVLNELILTGDTEISAPNLRIVMNRLNRIRDGETGYSKQFKILDQVSPTPRESDYTQANMEYNAGKNRYPHIKPNDHYRVLLRELAGSGLDYINASFINGYRQRGTYIATQVPMENTVNDFWKMMWEYKSKIIVVLCKMAEDGETYHDFLPVSKGSSMMYGKLEVKFVSQQVSTDYMVKQVELSEDRGTDKHDAMTVTLFHYLRWPKNGSPQRTASLLEVIELVNKKQMSSGNKAITVMCNDGVGRTGTFICTHAQLERLKTEGVVDFFQSIKSARIQRAGLVPHVDQYVLCHTLVADFLNDFDAYANFKDLI